ncbi:MAG: TonB-dependent receptor plug domain-containing protein [Gammaproteobacteria bacterium]|nr:TonB-dependent receptor plug domain-containing protein [Gammaproteobacteria bacterium]MCW9055214.1 TonB-dependent receptor plug domain-containing protein [Gammaproteobacteria bacterium]
MFRIPIVFLSILFIAICGRISLAQELVIAELTENDYFGDLPVVLTTTRLKQSKKNSPTATTIIDREMIEASGFTEIADLLRLAPGMLVNYDSGHIANAGYQFLYDRYRVRLQVLVDGMSVYTPLFGEMPWTQLGITIDDIDRIEVIRGPSSASYGPNAMTGVISIITKHAVLDSGISLKANQGSMGRSEQFLTMGDTSGNLDYKLSLAARKDDGFENRYDEKDLGVAYFRGDYQATDNDVVTFYFNYSSGDYQEDSTPTLNSSMPDHIKNIEQSSLQAKWVHNLSDGNVFSLNYYQQAFDGMNNYVGDFTADGFGFVPIDESVNTNRKNIEFTYSVLSKIFSFTIGALYRIDNTIAPEFLYNTNKDIHTRQFFVNSELYLNESNVLNIGLLRDDNDTGGVTASPRIALNHLIGNDHTVRVSYSESTRSPFALEEYTNRVVYVPLFSTNVIAWSDLSDLEPEKIKSLEVGYIGNLNNNSTEVDLRVYRNQLSDLIVQDWSIGTGGFLQGDEFNVTGFEATISHQFENTRAILNYSRTEINAGDLIYGDPPDYETGSPEDSASILIMHDFAKKLEGSIGFYYTSEYQQLCCEIDQQDPRSRIDATVTKSFKLGKYNSTLRLVVQNAANQKVETRLFNNYDRQWYISFRVDH